MQAILDWRASEACPAIKGHLAQGNAQWKVHEWGQGMCEQSCARPVSLLLMSLAQSGLTIDCQWCIWMQEQCVL
eukprot:1526683-Alexandrium_andersonii.AAC.1